MIKLPPIFDSLNYKVTFFVSLILIALGVSFDQVFEENSIGTVILAIGALFLIITMMKKRELTESVDDELDGSDKKDS